jgi:predicted esterase
MRRTLILALAAMAAGAGLGPGQEAQKGDPNETASAFAGAWRTTLGDVEFRLEGDKLVGNVKAFGDTPFTGRVDGKALKLAYQDGMIQGEATLTLADSGRSFSGRYAIRNRGGGSWNGWKPDPEAPKAEPGDFAGLWLTDLGLMELVPQEDGAKFKGRYAIKGTSEIEGDRRGRRLDFRFHGFGTGRGWFDLDPEGRTLAGAAAADGQSNWFGWGGRRAPEYARHAKLEPGKVVAGSTSGLLTYHVRAPGGYKADDPKTWPAVVILHGSNMDSRSYVETIAGAWPDIARDFLLIGIDGERPSNTGPQPRFNYTYVNFVGKSKYEGFPNTDRESPSLVGEALAELKEVYPVRHYLVGGHSQGGFLTYSLLMNYPDLMAGAFPISCGVIFQCEPSAYEDEAVRKAQRAVPLAIVHGRGDPVVPFDNGQYASNLFGEASWPALRFFAPESGGHMFARLPVDQVIRWLETLASDDPDALIRFAQDRSDQGAYRDAIAALDRARRLDLSADQKARLDAVAGPIDARARAEAARLLPLVRADADASWIDDLLAFRDQFEFSPESRDLMAAFLALRERHTPIADKAMSEARKAFQQGRRDDGFAKYDVILKTAYASPLYRNVKHWVESRRD